MQTGKTSMSIEYTLKYVLYMGWVGRYLGKRKRLYISLRYFAITEDPPIRRKN